MNIIVFGPHDPSHWSSRFVGLGVPGRQRWLRQSGLPCGFGVLSRLLASLLMMEGWRDQANRRLA